MDIKRVYTSLESLSPLLLGVLQKDIAVTMTVKGGSMYPMLTSGRDEVLLKSLASYRLKKGDIVLYTRDNGQYILHRIVRTHENGYDLCGDHQYLVEKNIPGDRIIAVVKQFKRNGRLHKTEEIGYRIYFRLWILLLPLRRLLAGPGISRVRRLAGQLKRTVRRLR